jgi:hypothetical protein
MRHITPVERQTQGAKWVSHAKQLQEPMTKMLSKEILGKSPLLIRFLRLLGLHGAFQCLLTSPAYQAPPTKASTILHQGPSG